ncbi:hypothetical protein [Methylobacterium brachiatum]|uniref:hypothetical protein n=1 Tax=Methylobacterium brachiatum TaxID=269660 RepID=UPI00244A047A|nr:hypothetical protein [Methylobacterium brachiatum]MDH2310192.1 hypothetical protein [Methylobacterium brachiatum]
MAKRINRKLELFTIHAHEMPEADYNDIFDQFNRIPKNQRIARIYGTVIGFPFIERTENGYFIQALEGDLDAIQVVFDLSTGEAKESDLGSNEVYGQATHFIVVPSARSAAIEYVRSGAKAILLGPAIAEIMRNNFEEFSDLQVEFAPKIQRAFEEEIDLFERIRMASIRVTRPNASWTDHYSDLSDLMDQSDGDKASIDVRAGRGGSLNKNGGIVQVIKDVSTDEFPYIEEASVTGTRQDEVSETTVRSKSHVIHSRVVVDADDTGTAYSTSIRRKLSEFISSWIRA